MFLIGLSLYVYPWTGLRNGFLTILFSLVAFFFIVMISSAISRKKKIAIATPIVIVFLLFLATGFAGQKRTILGKRMAWSFSVLKEKITVSELFTEKLRLWKVVSFMIRDYPLTGVGVGAYIVELPNYSKLAGDTYRSTDSAENYFFQVGSELGLIGLFLILWIFYEVIKKIMSAWGRRWKEKVGHSFVGIAGRDGRDRFIVAGISLGIFSLWINFLFHSYMGSYEAIYLFWLLVGLVFVMANGLEERREKESSPLSRQFKAGALSIALLFGAIHLWNSSHSLSLHSRREKLGLPKDFGF